MGREAVRVGEHADDAVPPNPLGEQLCGHTYMPAMLELYRELGLRAIMNRGDDAAAAVANFAPALPVIGP